MVWLDSHDSNIANNFVFFENEPDYISIVCDLLSQSTSKPDQLAVFFYLLEQYSYCIIYYLNIIVDGSIQRLLNESKFIELLRRTERQIADNNALLQQNMKTDEISTIFEFSKYFCTIFYYLAERIWFGGSFIVGLSMIESQDYPVLGEVFTFLETVISTIFDKEVVLSAVQVCESLLNGGIVFDNGYVMCRC